MIKDFFRKPKYVTVKTTPVSEKKDKSKVKDKSEKKDIPEGLWLKCEPMATASDSSFFITHSRKGSQWSKFWKAPSGSMSVE